MTKKKNAVAKVNKNKFDKFVNFSLGESDKEAITEQMLSADKVLDRMGKDIEAGYAFKLTWDNRSGCYMVMMIGEYTQEFNKGCIMSARHSDVIKAFNILQYQHHVLSMGEGWDAEDKDPFINDW